MFHIIQPQPLVSATLDFDQKSLQPPEVAGAGAADLAFLSADFILSSKPGGKLSHMPGANCSWIPWHRQRVWDDAASTIAARS